MKVIHVSREFSIVLALCRCSLYNNPTEAVKHQIRRLIKLYEDTGQGHLAEKLNELFREPNEDNFKIVQSNH